MQAWDFAGQSSTSSTCDEDTRPDQQKDKDDVKDNVKVQVWELQKYKDKDNVKVQARELAGESIPYTNTSLT